MQAAQRQPVSAQRPRIQFAPVENRPAQAGRPQFDEAGRAGLAAAEPDGGARTEYVLAAAEVKVEVIVEDVDQPGACLRLGVGQRARRCSRCQRDPPSLAEGDRLSRIAVQLRIGTKLRTGLARQRRPALNEDSLP
jgi:hypothetical protein